MATPSPCNIAQVWGRLSHSPTDLSLAYPHGGTAIATCDKPTVFWTQEPFEIRSHAFGGAVSDVIYAGEDCILKTELREILDPAALAAIFPIYTTGLLGGVVLRADANSAARSGTLLGALAKVIVFTPFNIDKHPFLIVRRGVPALQETAKLVFSSMEEARIPVQWYMTPDSNGKQYEFGKRTEITL